MAKNIALIAGDITNGLSYQRGHLFFRHLRDKFNFIPLNLSEIDISQALYFDAMVFLHPYHSDQLRIIQRAKAQYQVPTIVDLDDLVTDMPTDHPMYAEMKGNSASSIIMFADHVVVSTEYLHNAWGHLNKNMTVIENAIDPARYKSYSEGVKPYHAGFVVGWTGSPSHRPDLYNTGFIDGLMKMMEKYEDVRAYFHGLCPHTIMERFGHRIIFNEAYTDVLDYPAICYSYPFDVCCAPLTKNNFNDGKSDLKLLDMAPFKIPLLASPRAPFTKHTGTDRCMYAEDGKWFDALEWCYTHRADMKYIAARANEYVSTHRTISGPVAQWESILSSLTK